MAGTLYLCGTPIGNLEDMTYRAVRILNEVDYIAAEDTRQTAKLLNRYEIKKPMISYHEHNKKEKGIELLKLLQEEKNIALVSDAGMPAISDPGEDLVKLMIENAIPITVIPGATASLTALIVSGMSTRYFCFEGFLPVASKERKERLEKLQEETRTIIIYEAPHKLLKTLKDLQTTMGDRQLSISRELTKKFEETVRGKISQSIAYFEEKSIKGEFVLILEAISEKEILAKKQEKWDNISVEEHLHRCLEKGMTKKEAIAEVATLRTINKKEVYKIATTI